MYGLVTIVGVSLGYCCAAFVNRRYGLRSYRRWLLLTPLWVLYVIVLLTADTGDLAPQAVQALALGTLSATLTDVVGSLWSRRTPDSRGRALAHGADETLDGSTSDVQNTS